MTSLVRSLASYDEHLSHRDLFSVPSTGCKKPLGDQRVYWKHGMGKCRRLTSPWFGSKIRRLVGRGQRSLNSGVFPLSIEAVWFVRLYLIPCVGYYGIVLFSCLYGSTPRAPRIFILFHLPPYNAMRKAVVSGAYPVV